MGDPEGAEPNDTCLQIVNQLENLCSHLESPAELWRGQHTGEVALAFRQIAADVRRQELASTSMQAGVRRMLAGKKALRDRQVVAQYLQLSICNWIVTRGVVMQTNATQAP